MNFLAHLYLSGDNDDLRFGNFIADLVKGKEVEQYTEPVQRGIALHRFIDQFTDHHPIWISTRNTLRNTQGKYAGVVTDIFYDHFLAKHWQSYHTQSLMEYAEEIYTLLNRRYEELPPRGKHLLPYMIRHNWLVSYSGIEGIGKVLGGMSRRTPYESKMHLAEADLIAQYSAFEHHFLGFFPHLEQECKAFIRTHGW